MLGLSGGGILSFSSAFAKVDNDDELTPVSVRANPPARVGYVSHTISEESKGIPGGRVEIMDVDLTRLLCEGDAALGGNLAFKGVLGSMAFAVLDRVGLVIALPGTFETLRTGELSFIGDPGGTGSSRTGSVGTLDRLDMEELGSYERS